MATPPPAKPIITVAPVHRPTEALEPPAVTTFAQAANMAPVSANGTGTTVPVAPHDEAGAADDHVHASGVEAVRSPVVAAPVVSAPTPASSSANVPAPASASLDGHGPAETTTPAPKTTSRRTRAKTAAPPELTAKPAPRKAVEMQTITSAIFVTGTVGLTPGSRYTIRHDGDQLQVVGPTDRNPRKVAFKRPLAETDATSPDGRLILSAPGSRGGTVLVFMGVDGDPAVVAAAVNRAAAPAPTS